MMNDSFIYKNSGFIKIKQSWKEVINKRKSGKVNTNLAGFCE